MPGPDKTANVEAFLLLLFTIQILSFTLGPEQQFQKARELRMNLVTGAWYGELVIYLFI